MAISKSFFGLRRGSTKSLTFSIYNGKQVTKDRVAFVKNPNTIAQRLQRMKFLALQLLLNAGLGEIVDHSWENKKYGSESRNYFMSKALKLSGPYIGKDQETAVPIPVQVSEGSLPAPQYVFSDVNFTTQITVVDSGGNLVLPVGTQITIIGLMNGVVFIGRAILTSFTPADGSTPLAFTVSSSGEVFVQLTDRGFTFTPNVPSMTASPIYGYALIASRYENGKWLRSNAFMQISQDAEAAYYTAEAMNVAVQSWDTNANNNMLSNWYLNLSETVYDGADVVISVATSAGGRTKVRARMVNVQGELIPYIYTTDGTSSGYCITQSGARSSVTGSQITGAIGFVQWGSVGNSTGNNSGHNPAEPEMP